MATSARLFRRILPRTLSRPLSGKVYSVEAAVQSVPPQAPPAQAIREYPDRVKWDYSGIPLGQWIPKTAVDAYVAPNVVLAGQVVVYDDASAWNAAVMRDYLNKTWDS